MLRIMHTQSKIDAYIASQPEPKRSDLRTLHDQVIRLKPTCKRWFLDGKNSENKTVSNPNIGYGMLTMHYADGSSREFYQVGISANTTGLSVYIFGMTDKTYLTKTYEKRIGKAKISGYCIKFKTLKDLNLEVLLEAMQDGFNAGNT